MLSACDGNCIGVNERTRGETISRLLKCVFTVSLLIDDMLILLYLL
jgi:hypothetical protein